MTAAAVFFVAILAVTGGFLLGRHRGRQAGLVAGYEAGRTTGTTPANDLEAARRQPPATYLIGGLLEPPTEAPGDQAGGASPSTGPPLSPASPGRVGPEGAPARSRPGSDTAGAPSAAWVDGFTYVVVQEFPSGGRNDAVAAQSYLAEHGVETSVVSLPAGRAALMTTQGFDRKDPTQRKRSDQLLEKIRAIGAQYYASGGRYKLEGYLKTHKGP